MDDFSNLLALCALMFILTYLIGYLPMVFRLSPSKLELISICGAGFLLGTAFIVIVPEGLSVLMETSGILHANHEPHHAHHSPHHPHHHPSRELNDEIDIDIGNIDTDMQLHMLQDDDDDDDDNETVRRLLSRSDHDGDNNPIILIPGESDTNSHDTEDGTDDEHNHTHTHDPIVHSVFRKMGCFICFGFIFMMAVEKLSAHSHSHSHNHSYHHKDKDLEDTQALTSHTTHSHAHSHHDNNITSFMIGLLTHSAVDGIALGAISAEGNAHSLSLLVFVALMAHKGPAAISMTAFLQRKLSEEKDKKRIIKQLIAFSCAAPMFSILTYVVLNSFSYFISADHVESDQVNESHNEMLAYCLLFSGGTFLYVVTLHIIPEIKEWRNINHNQDLLWTDLLVITVGCVLPSLFEHSH